MKNSLYVLCVATVILFASSITCFAQSDTLDLTELSLDELSDVKIVTASKTLQNASQAPATVVVVTEEQIRIRGYRSLLDVLMDAPDFKIDDKMYARTRNRITMRGIEGQEKILIMVDGVRISSPTNEIMPIMENYPVHLAKQIEIIYGPASALYGADAYSGIINIISKKSDFAPSKTEASLIMGDHGLYNGNVYASKRIRKDIFLTVSGQYFYDKGVDLSEKFSGDTLWNMTSHKTGTFNTIYGPMTPVSPVSAKYEAPLMAYNIFAKLNTADFDFTFFRNYSQNSSALENNPSNAVYNKDVFYGRSISSLSAKYTKSLDKFSFITTITASQYRVNPNSNYRNMYSGMEPAYKYAYGSVVRTEEQVEWRISNTTNLVGGLIFENFFSLPESPDLQNPVKDSHSIEGTLLNTASYYRPEGLEAKFYAIKYHNIGGYTQLQQKVMKNSTITVGVRYDNNSRFGSTFNPRVGVVMNASKQTTIKAMAATAYLAPSPGNSYSYYGTFQTLDSGRTYQSNFMHLPNPTLKPMVSRNAELSINQYIGKNFSMTLTGYYTQVTNLLNFGSDEGNTDLYNGKFLGWDVDYIEVYLNQGKETAIGGSLMLAYNHRFPKGTLRTYANLSIVDGSESDLGEAGSGVSTTSELDNIAPLTLKTGFDLTWNNFYFSPRLIWLNHQRLEGATASEERQIIGGYTLLNISLGYKLGVVSVFGNVSNALNQTYRTLGPNMDLENKNTELFYGNVQDPIRVNAGLRVSF